MSTKKAQLTKGLVTGDNFELEEIETKSGRWAARLWFVTRQGRTKNYVCSAVLRERARGHIILDLGSRGRGGRPSLGTSDYQKAVERAQKRLARLGQALVTRGEIERTLEVAGGDLTIPQLAAVYFDKKNPRKRNIGQHHADNMVRMFDIMLELNGPDWTVSRADQAWIDRMIREQMEGISFTRVDRQPLEARGWNTARDAVGYFMGAVSLACRTPDPHRPGRKMQDTDPFEREDVELPKGRAPKPKKPVGIEHHLRLMTPVRLDGQELPAPVDRADPSGITRLMQAAFFGLGVRRKQLRRAKRGHLALTPAGVRIMVARYGHSIRNEDARHLEHGAWLLEGAESKMGHLGEEEYTRVLPLSFDLRGEIELYLERNPDVAKGDPESPLFPSSQHPGRPISDSVMFGAHEWQWETGPDGEPLRDLDGNLIAQQDDGGRWRLKRKGGRFYSAEDIVRDDLTAQGIEWTELFPYDRGSCVHSWRGHLEVLMETLGYIRTVVGDDGREINLTRHVDYLLGRKLSKSVRFRHYIPLDPAILMGMIELQEADQVLAQRGVRKAAQVAEGQARIREAREALRLGRQAA